MKANLSCSRNIAPINPAQCHRHRVRARFTKRSPADDPRRRRRPLPASPRAAVKECPSTSLSSGRGYVLIPAAAEKGRRSAALRAREACIQGLIAARRGRKVSGAIIAATAESTGGSRDASPARNAPRAFYKIDGGGGRAPLSRESI